MARREPRAGCRRATRRRCIPWRRRSASLKRLNPVDYDVEIAPHPRCAASSAMPATSWARRSSRCGWASAHRRKLVFSGDLGQPGAAGACATPRTSPRPTCCWSSRPTATATTRAWRQTLDELFEAINDTIASRRGNVVIPAFAVGRTQDILYLLGDLRGRGACPKWTCSSIRRWRSPPPNHLQAHGAAGRRNARTDGQSRRRCAFRSSIRRDVEDSMAINQVRAGAVDHLRQRHVRGRAHQAPPARTTCRAASAPSSSPASRPRARWAAAWWTAPNGCACFGEDYPGARRSLHPGRAVGACRPHCAARLAGALSQQPRQVFVVHGEETVATGFADELRKQLGWDAMAPAPGHSVILD